MTKEYITNCVNMKPRQVPIFLYWRVENVLFWINSIGHNGWLNCILNFPRFHKNVNSLELWKYISENSLPKGSFWRNKRKSEFSLLSTDSRYLLAVALKHRTYILRVAWRFSKSIHIPLLVSPEAYHLEAFHFPYTFETMLPIIPDQWKSLFQFLPILGNSE